MNVTSRFWYQDVLRLDPLAGARPIERFERVIEIIYLRLRWFHGAWIDKVPTEHENVTIAV